ncbi:MAG: hypothetical protein ACR2KC_06825 [Acidimicrobiales bacterium]
MKRIPFALFVLVWIVATGCGGGASHQAAPASATSPFSHPSSAVVAAFPTSTTAVPNPAVIPPVIDANYVNAVFRQLNHIIGDVTRLDLAADAVPKQSATDLRAAFNDPWFNRELTLASESLVEDTSNVRRPPGDRVTSVRQLVSAGPRCIFAQTVTDYSPVLIRPAPPAASEYYMLTPKLPGNDPEGVNSTPWAIAYNRVYTTPTQVPSTCPASS